MTTTEKIETCKIISPAPTESVRRGLNGRVLLGTLGVLGVLFAIGMVPRWQARAALTNSALDQRPTVNLISSLRPENNAKVVLPGSTQAIQEAAIYARTNGYVRRWLVDIGAKVEAGQLLAEIETPEVDQELNQAHANVAQALANAELARATLARWQALQDKKVVSSQEFDEKKAAADARDGDLKVAQANVKRLEELQGFEKIVSPFSGTITARNIDIGILVSSGGSSQSPPLFRVAQTDTLRLYVTVPQTLARSIVAGQTALVSIREVPDRTFEAKVVRTAGALDPASRTLLTELRLPNVDGQLFPGMYAEVTLALPADGRTLLIPGNAITIQSDGPKVLVVDAKQTVRVRAVKLGRDLGDKVEILSGLEPNEPLVANPSGLLRDGTEVKIQTPPSNRS